MEDLIALYRLSQRKGSENLFDGFGTDPFLALENKWHYESTWSNGFRSVYINLEERLIFTYVEGDLTLKVCKNHLDFYKELQKASAFYETQL